MAEEQNREAQNLERAKQQLAEERKVSDHARAEYAERMKGKPTPTQEENDLHACGAYLHTHEDDGSGPDPFAGPQRKILESDRPAGGGYQTRHTAPVPAPPHRPAPRHSGGE